MSRWVLVLNFAREYSESEDYLLFQVKGVGKAFDSLGESVYDEVAKLETRRVDMSPESAKVQPWSSIYHHHLHTLPTERPCSRLASYAPMSDVDNRLHHCVQIQSCTGARQGLKNT
jgi:hypothetical protein